MNHPQRAPQAGQQSGTNTGTRDSITIGGAPAGQEADLAEIFGEVTVLSAADIIAAVLEEVGLAAPEPRAFMHGVITKSFPVVAAKVGNDPQKLIGFFADGFKKKYAALIALQAQRNQAPSAAEIFGEAAAVSETIRPAAAATNVPAVVAPASPALATAPTTPAAWELWVRSMAPTARARCAPQIIEWFKANAELIDAEAQRLDAPAMTVEEKAQLEDTFAVIHIFGYGDADGGVPVMGMQQQIQLFARMYGLKKIPKRQRAGGQIDNASYTYDPEITAADVAWALVGAATIAGLAWALWVGGRAILNAGK